MVYQLAHAETPFEQTNLIKQLAEREKEFFERENFWVSEKLPTSLSHLMQTELFPSGKLLYSTINTEYILAIESGNKTLISEKLASIQVIFLNHRKAVDKLVMLAQEDLFR